MILDACGPESLVILGPTACGKTQFAIQIARARSLDIISVDSRQIYRHVDLCTGKDLAAFGSGPDRVPLHLTSLLDLPEESSLFSFARLVQQRCRELARAERSCLFCGGTGLYLDALIKQYRLEEAAPDENWRRKVTGLSDEALRKELKRLRPKQHNETDLEDRDRILRAIEVARAGMEEQASMPLAARQPLVLGLTSSLPRLKDRIRQRLLQRLEEGMIDEVRKLLDSGVSRERLHRLGLELRWITRLLEEGLPQAVMVDRLSHDIYQFARNQMSWFRRMERQGLQIHWQDAQDPDVQKALELIDQHEVARAGGRS